MPTHSAAIRTRAFSQHLDLHSMTQFSRLFLRSAVAACALASFASAQVSTFKLFGAAFVVGSNGSDKLEIKDVNGAFVVQGNAGTTVNGGVTKTLTGITGPVFVLTGGGDDVLTMVDNVRSAGMLISLGSGDDLMYAERNQVAGDLWVDAGMGGVEGDLVVLSGTGGGGNQVLGTMLITGERVAASVRDCSIGQHLAIFTGDRDDFLHIANNTVLGSVMVDTRGGNDEIRFASYPPSLGNHVTGGVFMDSGAGNDIVWFGSTTSTNSVIGGCSYISTGAGDDDLIVQHCEFNSNLWLDGGADWDSGQFQDAGYLNVFGGAVHQQGFEILQ